MAQLLSLFIPCSGAQLIRPELGEPKNAGFRQMPAGWRKLLELSLSPFRLLAEPTPFLHINNEKRKPSMNVQ